MTEAKLPDTTVGSGPGRFSRLLLAIVLLLLLRPFLEGIVLARFLLSSLFTVTLLSALFCVTRPRWALRVGLALIIPAVVLGWVPSGVMSPAVIVIERACMLLAFAFTAFVIVMHTLEGRRVTLEHIAGALSAYLLLGLAWAMAYVMLESASPGSLSLGLAESDEALFGASVYYSFVTLTTLGYGDIQPVSSQARALAMVEAAFGQIYLAVLVANLVSMYQRSSDAPNA